MNKFAPIIQLEFLLVTLSSTLSRHSIGLYRTLLLQEIINLS